MTTDLETDLRTAFAREAQRVAPLVDTAPDAPGDPRDVGVPFVVTRPSVRRRPVRMIAAGTIAAASIAVLVAITLRPVDTTDSSDSSDSLDQADAPGDSAPSFVPAGVEAPLITTPVDVEPFDTYVLKPGSAIAMTVDGQAFTQFITVMPYGGEARQVLCQLERGGGAGCVPFEGAVPQTVGQTSSIDNGVHDTDFWMWTGVPADVVFVEFHHGDEVLWQRPAGGLVSFPLAANGTEPYAIGFDADGTELARISRSTAPDDVRPPAPDRWELWEALSQTDKDRSAGVIDGAMGPCTDAGTDWETCLAEADEAYLAWLLERTPAADTTAPAASTDG